MQLGRLRFCCASLLRLLPAAGVRRSIDGSAHPAALAAITPSLPQCKGVLPSETLPDGTKPPQKWNHYQFWWQTIMTKAAPELRAMGWSNLKCAWHCCCCYWFGVLLFVAELLALQPQVRMCSVRASLPVRLLSDAKSATSCHTLALVVAHSVCVFTARWCRILSDAKSANERRMASCADLLITSTTMFWQLYPFK